MTTVQLFNELRAAALQDPSDASRLRDAKQNLAARGDETVRELDSLLGDSFTEVREAAADVLESIGSEEAYDKLVEFSLRHLQDPSHQTKLPGPGWKRLRRIGKNILPSMARRYHSSLPFDTRLTMIFIAQQIGAPEGRALIDRALSESDPRIIKAAGEALGAVDGPGAYDRLVQLLSSRHELHRLGAVRGFERLGNPSAVRPLLEALVSADQTVPSAVPSSSEGAFSIRAAIADTIDSLTETALRGDVKKIQVWLDAHSI